MWVSAVRQNRYGLCSFCDCSKLLELSVLFWPERVINYVALLATSVCHFSMITSGISPVIIFFSGMSEICLVVVSCYCVLGLDRNRKDEKSLALLCYLKRRIHATCLLIRWESLEGWNTSHNLFSYLLQYADSLCDGLASGVPFQHACKMNGDCLAWTSHHTFNHTDCDCFNHIFFFPISITMWSCSMKIKYICFLTDFFLKQDVIKWRVGLFFSSYIVMSLTLIISGFF